MSRIATILCSVSIPYRHSSQVFSQRSTPSINVTLRLALSTYITARLSSRATAHSCSWIRMAMRVVPYLKAIKQVSPLTKRLADRFSQVHNSDCRREITSIALCRDCASNSLLNIQRIDNQKAENHGRSQD